MVQGVKLGNSQCLAAEGDVPPLYRSSIKDSILIWIVEGGLNESEALYC